MKDSKAYMIAPRPSSSLSFSWIPRALCEPTGSQRKKGKLRAGSYKVIALDEAFPGLEEDLCRRGQWSPITSKSHGNASSYDLKRLPFLLLAFPSSLGSTDPLSFSFSIAAESEEEGQEKEGRLVLGDPRSESSFASLYGDLGSLGELSKDERSLSLGYSCPSGS